MHAAAQPHEPNLHATMSDSLTANAQAYVATGHSAARDQEASVAACQQKHASHNEARTSGLHEDASSGPTSSSITLISKPPAEGSNRPPKEEDRPPNKKRQLSVCATLPAQVAKPGTQKPTALTTDPPHGLATMFELCAGSASLSVHAQRAGFHTYPVDHAANRFRPRAAAVCIDMSQSWASQLLVEAVHRTRPVWLHAGLPCGTCSRARDRPISQAVRRQGAPQPRPLRDADNLEGMPGLSGHEQDRVTLANAVYTTAEAVLYACYEVGTCVSLENPERSWLWPLLAAKVKSRNDPQYHAWYFALEDVSFSACAWGGERPKNTRLKASPKVFHHLRAKCPGVSAKHVHLPYNIAKTSAGWQFDTASEAQYPDLLCKKMVECVTQTLPESVLRHTAQVLRLATLASTGRQTVRHAQMVPEFHHVEQWRAQAKPSVPCKALTDAPKVGEKMASHDLGEKLSSRDCHQPPGRQSDPGIKLGENLSGRDCHQPSGYQSDPGIRLGENLSGQPMCRQKGSHEEDPNMAEKKNVKYGIYYTPEQHIEQALGLQHPSLTECAIPDDVKVAAFNLFTKGHTELAKMRVQKMMRWTALKKELEEQEKEMRKSLDADVNRVTEGKPLLLFERLLQDTGFQDKSVVDHMRHGVRLTGWEEPSPLYGPKYTLPTLTSEQLDEQALTRRQALLARKPTADELAQAPTLKAESEEEVQRGFLRGPYTSPEQVTEAVGCETWSLTKRFVLLQGEEQKPRVIDNFRESAVNAAFGVVSHLTLQDSDFLASLCAMLMRMARDSNTVEVTLSDGIVLSGDVHPEMKCQPAFQGRCFDLSKAYKQVAIHPSSVKHAVLGHVTQDKKWLFYISRSLPFGATASVYGFNKVTRALLHLLVVELNFLSGVYFDDFPVIEVAPLCRLTSKTMASFFELFGWLHATHGKKAVDFSGEMVALGVVFVVKNLWSQTFEISNKQGRLDRLLEILERGRNDLDALRAAARQIHGLLNFASGFVLGHSLKPCAQGFSELANFGLSVADHEVEELRCLTATLLRKARPRSVEPCLFSSPLIIYTDGAFEQGVGTWGALVLDREAGTRTVFSGRVPDELIKFWTAHAGKQVICEVEMYAFLCVRWQLRHAWKKRSAICFIDNEACRVSLIKRRSASPCMFAMLTAISILDTVVPTSVWFERVPSAANPADLPSRGESAKLCAAVGAQDCGDICLPDQLLAHVTKLKYDIQVAEALAQAAELECSSSGATGQQAN